MFSFLQSTILTRAFWGDEAWTALISMLPVSDLIKTTAADFHPPLYYLLLHFWIGAFGYTEVSIRAVSLIFWLLSGWATYRLGQSFGFQKNWSLLAALFTLFNPFIFLYAFEARNYTLLIFLSIASMWQFHEILKGKGHSWLYILSCVLGFYTHYYMFFIVGAQYLFVLLAKRDLFRKFLFYSLLFILTYLPWTPFFLSQGKSVISGYWIPPLTFETIRETAKVLTRGEQYTQLFNTLPGLFAFYLIATGILAIIKRRFFSSNTLLLALWLIIPFLVPTLLSKIKSIFFYRYLIITTVPLMLLPLWFAGETREDKKKKASPHFQKLFLLMPLLFLGIYIYTDWVSVTTRNNQLFRATLQEVQGQAKSADTIYTVLPSFAEVVYYNMSSESPLPVKVIPEGLAQASGKALLDTYVRKGYLELANPPRSGRYWLLEPGPKTTLIKNQE